MIDLGGTAPSGGARAPEAPAGAPPLVLASRSPQRRAILTQLGIPFRVVVSGVDERADGDPPAVVTENARRKAEAVAAAEPLASVLGVDTLVALDRTIYGKPASVDHARATLQALSGRTHVVLSGVCLITGGAQRTAVARTEVTFRALPAPLLEWYLEQGEWRERAGGYAIQGRGAVLVTGIAGDYCNVVGLPAAALLDLAPELVVG